MENNKYLILLEEKECDLLRNLLSDCYCYSEFINLAKKTYDSCAIWKEEFYDDKEIERVADNVTNSSIIFDEFGDEFTRTVKTLKEAVKEDPSNKILKQLGELLTGDPDWLEEAGEE